MTSQTKTTEPGRPSVALVIGVYAAALILGGTTLVRGP